MTTIISALSFLIIFTVVGLAVLMSTAWKDELITRANNGDELPLSILMGVEIIIIMILIYT